MTLLAATPSAHAQHMKHMDDMGQHDIFSTLSFDRLEMQRGGGYWDGQGWFGRDLDKAWLKTEGDCANGQVCAANLELLYSRAIAPWWDIQVGARHDFSADNRPGRDWAALALHGTTPYNFRMDASLYLGNGAAARIKAGYTLLLTQRFALLPELEANLYSQSDPARIIGAGLSNLDFSLRLRYEITREFSPYVGVMWSNRYGSTAGFARDRGENANTVSAVAGVQVWW